MMKARKILKNIISSSSKDQVLQYNNIVVLSYSYQLYHSRTEQLTTTLLSDEQ